MTIASAHMIAVFLRCLEIRDFLLATVSGPWPVARGGGPGLGWGTGLDVGAPGRPRPWLTAIRGAHQNGKERMG